MTTALITGLTGQDGSYLTEFLLGKGYVVHGLVRRASTFNFERIDHIPRDRFHLHYGDLADGTSLRRIIDRAQPDEVYHLAAQSHVRISFDIAEYTADTVFMGTLRLLEAVRDHMDITGRVVKFYQAGSSEMYGNVPGPQNEDTPFSPRSPYAIAKVAAHHLGQNYRDAYGMFICNGILFNHESPRRGENFVTRKITRTLGRIKHGLEDELRLGNLDAKRDWGFAGDYVRAMWMMLQHHTPDDYVIATGESRSVGDFLKAAFHEADLNPLDFVKFDSEFLRPTEVDELCGDASKARRVLSWRPMTSFDVLVRTMVRADDELARIERVTADAVRGMTHVR